MTISRLKTNFNLSSSYSAHKSSNHKCSRQHVPQSQSWHQSNRRKRFHQDGDYRICCILPQLGRRGRTGGRVNTGARILTLLVSRLFPAHRLLCRIQLRFAKLLAQRTQSACRHVRRGQFRVNQLCEILSLYAAVSKRVLTSIVMCPCGAYGLF